jgi:hypothetical protein
MALAVLSGHAIAAGMPPLGRYADHTYVTSSDNRSWGCFGRSAGGASLANASGNGDSDIADCLSQQNSRAGLVYLVTGVCHQASNRILDPASALVTAARGYQASWHLYSTYGLPWPRNLPRHPQAEDWPLRQGRCYPPRPSGAPPPPSGGGRDDASFLARLRPLWHRGAPRKTTTPSQHQDDGLDLLREETRLMVHFRLGARFSKAKTEKVVEERVQLYEDRLPWAQEALKGHMDGGVFADKVNSQLNESLRRVEKEIGQSAYQALFDLAPGEFILVAERKIADEYFREIAV